LKTKPTRLNTSKEGTPKSSLHKLKDRQQSEVSKGINTRDNGFRNPNSWESIEGRPRVPEDRPYKLVESQKMIVKPEQAPISGLDPKTSRRTAKERPYILVKPWDIEETNDTRRNLRGYNALL